MYWGLKGTWHPHLDIFARAPVKGAMVFVNCRTPWTTGFPKECCTLEFSSENLCFSLPQHCIWKILRHELDLKHWLFCASSDNEEWCQASHHDEMCGHCFWLLVEHWHYWQVWDQSRCQGKVVWEFASNLRAENMVLPKTARRNPKRDLIWTSLPKPFNKSNRPGSLLQTHQMLQWQWVYCFFWCMGQDQDGKMAGKPFGTKAHANLLKPLAYWPPSCNRPSWVRGKNFLAQTIASDCDFPTQVRTSSISPAEKLLHLMHLDLSGAGCHAQCIVQVQAINSPLMAQAIADRHLCLQSSSQEHKQTFMFRRPLLQEIVKSHNFPLRLRPSQRKISSRWNGEHIV